MACQGLYVPTEEESAESEPEGPAKKKVTVPLIGERQSANSRAAKLPNSRDGPLQSLLCFFPQIHDSINAEIYRIQFSPEQTFFRTTFFSQSAISFNLATSAQL